MRGCSQRNSGFSLVEVTLALGIAAFCLMTVFGLMPVGMHTNRNATSQTAATNLIAAVVADLRATPRTNSTSLQFRITFGTNAILYFDGAGQPSTSLGATSCYRVSIDWSGSSGLRYADLKCTWPAAADPATTMPGGSVETFAAFDRN
jgi:uncharacterized protein (TIGR02598 family)